MWRQDTLQGDIVQHFQGDTGDSRKAVPGERRVQESIPITGTTKDTEHLGHARKSGKPSPSRYGSNESRTRENLATRSSGGKIVPQGRYGKPRMAR